MVAREPQTAPLYTEAEYLAFERAAEERHEYLDGVIYAMAGERYKRRAATSHRAQAGQESEEGESY